MLYHQEIKGLDHAETNLLVLHIKCFTISLPQLIPTTFTSIDSYTSIHNVMHNSIIYFVATVDGYSMDTPCAFDPQVITG